MRGARPCGSGAASTNSARGVSYPPERDCEVQSSWRPRSSEVQRNGSCCSVIADFFHQCADELAMILFKGLPLGFGNIELLASLRCRAKPFEADRGPNLRSCAPEPIWWDRNSIRSVVPSGIRNNDTAARVWPCRWVSSAACSSCRSAGRRAMRSAALAWLRSRSGGQHEARR